MESRHCRVNRGVGKRKAVLRIPIASNQFSSKNKVHQAKEFFIHLSQGNEKMPIAEKELIVVVKFSDFQFLTHNSNVSSSVLLVLY